MMHDISKTEVTGKVVTFNHKLARKSEKNQDGYRTR